MSAQVLYLAMTGLNATMDRITANTNNLANANTTAFKAQRPVFQSLPLYGQGLADRVSVGAAQDTADFAPGAIEKTGRNLDVALNGKGWIGVQASDGSIGLTRNGSLSISPTGMLQTTEGQPVLGQGGAPISLPPMQSVTIGQDGTVSGALVGQPADQIAALNRILLTNPPETALTRRPDGLFTDTKGKPTPDAKVKLEVGALETSNADTVGMMMSMLENTRTFQMQTELVHMVLNAQQGQGTPLSIT
ncbi:MAG TPA: flagellar basal body rod protein FlgF [Stellaceae bacterium]|jgi:flagellar basal-body rod protein FlgF|nr:flagellar basal body rod protein FlgF [Stellaceae bacterium]